MPAASPGHGLLNSMSPEIRDLQNIREKHPLGDTFIIHIS